MADFSARLRKEHVEPGKSYRVSKWLKNNEVIKRGKEAYIEGSTTSQIWENLNVKKNGVGKIKHQ
jgi:hypothetical protein